jgi:cytochrome b pre-mRNA-processing protein 3
MDVSQMILRKAKLTMSDCDLPQTYQSFFQLHLLHVLLLLPRLRALPPTQYAAYQSELLNHFFELAESEMRRVLGRGERERVVRKYMDDMGQQWKGAGVGLDAIMGMGAKDSGSDVELAAWIWRNLFQAKSILSVPPAPSEASRPGMTIAPFVKAMGEATPVDIAEATNEALKKANDFGPVAGDLEFVETLETIVRFARREVNRLGRVSDEDVMQGEVGEWGSPK